MSGLSDFDHMLAVRLPNWRRWGKQDNNRPDPEAGSGSIYSMGRADRQDEEAAPEEPLPRIDYVDAQLIQDLIGCDDPYGLLPPDRRGKISTAHRHVLVGFFIKERGGYLPRVHAAVRALLDAEELAIQPVRRLA